MAKVTCPVPECKDGWVRIPEVYWVRIPKVYTSTRNGWEERYVRFVSVQCAECAGTGEVESGG